MPKVKFLKDLCAGVAGTVRDVRQYEANVLIKLGAAELVNHQSSEKDYKLLMNLNGTPVVDDFGSLVEVPDVIPSPVRKSKKANKG